MKAIGSFLAWVAVVAGIAGFVTYAAEVAGQAQKAEEITAAANDPNPKYSVPQTVQGPPDPRYVLSSY